MFDLWILALKFFCYSQTTPLLLLVATPFIAFGPRRSFSTLMGINDRRRFADYDELKIPGSAAKGCLAYNILVGRLSWAWLLALGISGFPPQRHRL